MTNLKDYEIFIKTKLDVEKYNLLSCYYAKSSVNSMKVCRDFYEINFKGLNPGGMFIRPERNLIKMIEAKIAYSKFRKKALEFKADLSNFPEELNYLEKQN